MQVDINLTRTASDLITEWTAAKIYLYSSATADGSYSLVGSGTSLVSGTERYEIIDAAGTPGTTWYKFRVGKGTPATEADYTAYSAAWLSGSFRAYATLDDLREVVGQGNATGHDNLLTDLLLDVSADIDALTGRQFYRQPQVTGTETFYLDVSREGMRSLSHATIGAGCTDGRALDIISVTTLSIRTSESGSYTEVTAGDSGYYQLSGMGPGTAGTDWPYEDIALATGSSYTTWPRGYRSVKVIGARGFPYIPAHVKRVTLDEAHERWRESVGGGPTQIGVTAMGVPLFASGSPIMRLSRSPWTKRSWAAI